VNEADRRSQSEQADLAEQAAAWIPPWQRVSRPGTTGPDPKRDDEETEPAEPPEREWQQPETDHTGTGSDATVSGFESETGGLRGAGGAADAVEPDAVGPDGAVVPEEAAEGPDRTGRASDTAERTADDVERGSDEDEPGKDPGADDDETPDRDAQQPETDQAEPLPDRPADVPAAMEAILLIVDEPVATDVLAEVLHLSVDETHRTLQALASQYTADGRGFDLRRAAGGWRLYTRATYAPYVERFVRDGQTVRLTQAALETLAVVAYQQPVTRARMSAIRGVNCDGVVRTLTGRGLIEECGTQPESGAFLYRTTPLFLEKLGLDSLDELPPLAPFLPDDVNGLADA
jgi:segregation and condensation protein B